MKNEFVYQNIDSTNRLENENVYRNKDSNKTLKGEVVFNNVPDKKTLLHNESLFKNVGDKVTLLNNEEVYKNTTVKRKMDSTLLYEDVSVDHKLKGERVYKNTQDLILRNQVILTL